jgi:hypothetical protein
MDSSEQTYFWRLKNKSGRILPSLGIAFLKGPELAYAIIRINARKKA